VARETQVAAEYRREARGKPCREEPADAREVQVDRLEIELRQLRIPVAQTDRSPAYHQPARRQVVERQSRCRAFPTEDDFGGKRELRGTQAIDDDVRRVELYAQCEQLSISKQL